MLENIRGIINKYIILVFLDIRLIILFFRNLGIYKAFIYFEKIDGLIFVSLSFFLEKIFFF